jgi:hypothetical protein
MSFKTFRKRIIDLPGGRRKGILEVDPIKKYTRSRWFKPNNQLNLPATPWVINLAANGASGPIPIEFDAADGHAEIFGAMVVSTGVFDIRIEDQGNSYAWQNRPLHSGTVFGTAQLPYYYPETYQVNVEESAKQLTIYLTDLSGAPNAVRIALFGRTFQHREAPSNVVSEFRKRLGERELTRLQFITTQQPLVGVTAAAATPFDLIIPTNFGFELMKLTYAATGGAFFEMELTENRSGQRFHQEGLRVHVSNMWGIGTLPFILPESMIIPKKYRMRGNMWNIAAGPNNFWLTMAGRQIRTTVPTRERGKDD